jgi:hypothetical protein
MCQLKRYKILGPEITAAAMSVLKATDESFQL